MLDLWCYGSLQTRMHKKLLGGIRDGRTSSIQQHPSLIIIEVRIKDSVLHAMVDTGATTSIVSRSVLDRIPHSPIQPMDTTTTLGDGRTKISVHGIVELPVGIDGIVTDLTVIIVESLGASLILGMDWCNQINANVNMETKQVIISHPKHGTATAPFVNDKPADVYLAEPIVLMPFHEHVVKVRTPIEAADVACFEADTQTCCKLNVQVPDAVVSIKDSFFYMCVYNPSRNVHPLAVNTRLGSVYQQPTNEVLHHILPSAGYAGDGIHQTERQIGIGAPVVDDVIKGLVAHIADVRERDDFLQILQQSKRSFDVSKMTRANTKIQHTIHTGNHPPTSVRPYFKTVEQRKETQQEVEKLIKDGILRPSTSPWSSPVLLKKKLDSTYRFLVDFRRLNSITTKDSYSQPSAEELIHRLAGSRYFSKLDLKSGYFQIPILEADIPKTAIATQDWLYEFTVLAQGLMNAPPTFQRVLNNLVANGRWDYVVVYLDDILIFSKTMEEHKQHLRDDLSTLHQANFQVSPAKCSIAVTRIEFLGHISTHDKVEPLPEKIKAILDIPPPRTLAQANKFMGKVCYYRKFIKDFARIAAPIHKVTNKTRTKKHEFKWGP